MTTVRPKTTVRPNKELRAIVRYRNYRQQNSNATVLPNLVDAHVALSKFGTPENKPNTDYYSPFSAIRLSPQPSGHFGSKKGTHKQSEYFSGEAQSFEEVINKDGTVIIYLQPKLGQMNGDESPIKMGGEKYQTVAQFLKQEGLNNVIIPCDSITRIGRAVKKAKTLSDSSEHIRIIFMGAVMKEQDFFLGENTNKIDRLIQDLKRGKETAQFDQTQNIITGLPHMIHLRFCETKNNWINSQNYAQTEHQHTLVYRNDHLQISDKQIQQFFNEATSAGVHILARPSITTEQANPNEPLFIQWEISNLSNQYIAANCQEPQEIFNRIFLPSFGARSPIEQKIGRHF